jgi:hypothetical protein
MGGPPRGNPPIGGPPMGGPPRGGPPMGGPARPVSAPVPAPAPVAPRAPFSGTPWHYLDKAGSQKGPVQPEQMRSEWKSGLVDGSCIAWNENLTDWTEVRR